MKCKIFFGEWYEAQDAFNEWAKGKTLDRTVIIHEQVYCIEDSVKHTRLMIIVYHPEGAIWDSTKSKPIQRVQPQTTESTGLERVEIVKSPSEKMVEQHMAGFESGAELIA